MGTLPGGPSYADSIGADHRGQPRTLASGLDERFEPCEYLLDLARKNKTFYTEPPRRFLTLIQH